MIKSFNPVISFALSIITLPLIIWWWSILMQKEYTLPLIYTIPCVDQIIFNNHPLGVWYYDPLKKQWRSAAHVLIPCGQWTCYFGKIPIQSTYTISWFDLWVFTGEQSYCNSSGMFIDDGKNTSILYSIINGQRKKIPVFTTGMYINIEVEKGQSGSPLRSWWAIRWVVSRKYGSWAIIERIP